MIEDMFPDCVIKWGESRSNGLKQTVLFSFLMVLLMVMVLAMPPNMQAAGKSIYVAPGGNNNNSGTINQPLKTIQAGIDRARAGDTVYVRDGTYVEEVRITRSGSSDNPVKVRAYPGETPVIDGRAGVDCLNCGLPDAPIVADRIDPRTGRGFNWSSLVGIQGDHVVFEGFIVKRSMGRGILVWGDDRKVSDVTLRNNQVLDSRNNGILTEGSKGTENILIENNVVWHAQSHAPWVDGRNSSVNWGSALTLKNSSHSIVRGNTVYENWGEGINNFKDSSYVTVEDNVVYDNFSAHIYIDRADHVTLQRNLVYNTNNPDFRRGGNPASCIVVNNESYSGNHTKNRNIDIINNIAVGCQFNFVVWNNEGQEISSENFLVAHNTFVNAVTNHTDDKARGVTFINDDYKDFRFENNIVYQGITTYGHEVGLADPGVSYANNLWYPHHPENGKGSGPGDVVGQDPQFADPRAYELPETWSQAPSRNWFQVKSGSPVIDRGIISQPFLADTDIIIDLFFGMRDSNPDIGVHEYGSEPAGKIFIPLIGQ